MSLAAQIADGSAAVSSASTLDNVDFRIELGRTTISAQAAAELTPGNTVVLDQAIGEPVQVFAQGQLVARGELTIQEDHFCVRVLELIR